LLHIAQTIRLPQGKIAQRCSCKDATLTERIRWNGIFPGASLVFPGAGDQDDCTRRSGKQTGGGGGVMDELIDRLADKAGLEKVVARKSVGIILDFLRKEGPPEPVQALIDTFPGAEAAIETDGGVRGGLARLMGGGVMAVGAKLMGLGLSIDDIKKLARELFKAGRDRIGEDQVAAIIAGTPGLRQFT
jgi:hypothetical protein